MKTDAITLNDSRNGMEKVGKTSRNAIFLQTCPNAEALLAAKGSLLPGVVNCSKVVSTARESIYTSNEFATRPNAL